MVASDNTRDPFYAYGDLDMLEVYRAATRLLHFDHDGPEWIRTVSATPADLMGLDRHGRIEASDAADLVLLRARSLTEWLARPHSTGPSWSQAGRSTPRRRITGNWIDG